MLFINMSNGDLCKRKRADEESELNANANEVNPCSVNELSESYPDKDCRARTPSGQIFNTKVKDIRNWLQNLNEVTAETAIKHVKGAKRSDTLDYPPITTNDSRQSEVKGLTSKEAKQIPVSVNASKELKTPLLQTKFQFNTKGGCKVLQPSHVLKGKRHQKIKEQPGVKHCAIMEEQIESDINKEETSETNTEETESIIMKVVSGQISEAEKGSVPEVVDIRLVTKMFKEIKVDMSRIETKLNKVDPAGTDQKLTILTQAQTQTNEEIRELNSQMNEYKMRTTILTGAVSKMAMVMSEMQTKIDRLENSNSKRMMVINGLYVSQKKNIRMGQLQQLFREEMMIDIALEDSYLIGENAPPSVVVTLAKAEDKYTIFNNIYMIKDMVNKDGNKIFFKDFTPAGSQEFKKRQKEVAWMAKQEDSSSEISYTKQGIAVGSRIYKKRVVVPDPSEILQMEDSVLQEILNMQLQKSTKSILKDNVFVAYSICTNSFEEIQKAYMHVKLANAGARHVVAAWNIPGEPKYEQCDFQDDEDHGIGRQICQIMKDNDIQSRAIFVARYFAGKLGPERFNAYADTVRAVIAQNPYNVIEAKEQKIEMSLDLPSPSPQMNNSEPRQRKSPGTQPPAKKFAKSYSNAAKGDLPRRGRGAYGQQRGQRGRGRGGQQNRVFHPRSEDLIKKAHSFAFSKPDKVEHSNMSAGRSSIEDNVLD